MHGVINSAMQARPSRRLDCRSDRRPRHRRAKSIKNLSPLKPAALVPPQLRTARLDDYEKIRQLALAHSLNFPPPEDWRSLWLDNPLMARLGKDWPIGWVLETATGEIVGNFGIVSSLYTFRGHDLISAAGRFWFVTAPYRGFALQLMDEYLNQPGVDLFINNAVSAPALGTFSRLLERIPLGDWESMSYFVAGYRGLAKKGLHTLRVPFAEALAYPAGAILRLKDAICNKPLPKAAASFTIEARDRFDSLFDVFWDELRRQNPEKLLAERSSRALAWHFGSPLRRRRLWIFTASRNEQLRAYCTLTRQDHPFSLPPLPHNETQGLRGMRLVDYQSVEPDADLLPALLASALGRCAKEDVDILENFGRGVPKMRALDDCAPYRKKLSNWKFFYSAADAGLNTELRAARFWDPSAYDGEASFE